MSLPVPDSDALAHSEALCSFIAEDIRRQGGWISFARYMELALYTPGLGYYSGGSQKFGAGGDFVTAPELSSMFGRTVAVQLAQIMAGSSPHVLEPGAGSGTLAADLLLQLEETGALPESYEILELSGELRQRQRATLEKRVPHLMNRVRWLDRLPESFSGAVVANEVLDAMPVHLVEWRIEGIFERGVVLADGSFAWEPRSATGALLEAAQKLPVTAPYLSEINLAVDEAGAREIARRSRGTPRIANNLLRRVRDYAQVKGDGKVTSQVADYALAMLEIDQNGLDEMDKRILEAIIVKFGGGPVGVNSLAVAVGEEPDTIEEVYEPYLIMEGYLNRTPQGRIATELSYQKLGLKALGTQPKLL